MQGPGCRMWRFRKPLPIGWEDPESCIRAEGRALPDPGVADLEEDGATRVRHVEVLGLRAALAVSGKEDRSRVDLVGEEQLDKEIALQLVDDVFI